MRLKKDTVMGKDKKQKNTKKEHQNKYANQKTDTTKKQYSGGKGKPGNVNHDPKTGRFTYGTNGIIIRQEPLTDDIESYTRNSYFGKKDFIYKSERIRNINRALYDGGYIPYVPDITENELWGNSFANVDEAEEFVKTITTNTSERDAWKDKRELVDVYLGVAKNYISKNIFSEPRDGEYQDGSYRDSRKLIEEFGLTRKDIQTYLMSLTSDDFVNSGKNITLTYGYDGTVVMVFAPRLTFYKINEETNKREKHSVDMYIKLCINPHPPKNPDDRTKKLPEFGVVSFKESTGRTCLYTGEERKSRKQWEELRKKGEINGKTI